MSEYPDLDYEPGGPPTIGILAVICTLAALLHAAAAATFAWYGRPGQALTFLAASVTYGWIARWMHKVADAADDAWERRYRAKLNEGRDLPKVMDKQSA